jgi:hypothetical protein
MDLTGTVVLASWYITGTGATDSGSSICASSSAGSLVQVLPVPVAQY